MIEELRGHGLQTGDMANMSVIELGCGWGRNLHLFLELGVPARNIAGVDLIDHFIAFGSSQNPSLNIRRWRRHETGFNDGSFDIVLLHTILSAFSTPASRNGCFGSPATGQPGGLIFVFDIADGYPAGSTVVDGELLAFIRPFHDGHLFSMANDAGLNIAGWQRSGLMPRLRKFIFPRCLQHRSCPLSAFCIPAPQFRVETGGRNTPVPFARGRQSLFRHLRADAAFLPSAKGPDR